MFRQKIGHRVFLMFFQVMSSTHTCLNLDIMGKSLETLPRPLVAFWQSVSPQFSSRSNAPALER